MRSHVSEYRSSGKNPALPNICGGNRVRALPAQAEDVDFSPGWPRVPHRFHREQGSLT
jgi:hypothetical protein